MIPDGVLGLAPTFTPNSDKVNSKTNGCLYLDSLFKAGAIGSRVFSIYLGRYFQGNQQSKITFGGWNDTYVLSQYTKV